MARLNNILFRKMLLEDIDAVNAIEQIAHYHPWSKKLISDAVTSYQCWTLIQDQQLIGYGILKIVIDEAELLNIAIDPSLQGKGFGKLLLQYLIQQAETSGARECFLEVRESNLNAYHLYENYGFNEIGRRPNYYPCPQGYEDALIMACILAADKF